MAEFIAERFPHARHVADVGGGQGMLTRILRKRLGVDAEVIDPRGWTLTGVPARVEAFDASMADYYDLVVGLHPDEALRSVVESAAKSAVLVIPCCNFWSRETKLGRDQLIGRIAEFHNSHGGKSERVVLDFRGPKNHALILLPPEAREARGEPPDSWAAAHPANDFIAAKAVLQHPRHEPININRIRQVPRGLVS
ncbi:MAG TPA: hypothetical protein VK802_00145 [Streptosporangiaceae bacterium]|nr:hypothetical protein [Streptosporangiaceae bacterium]